ncbi:MAG: choice-of-anchor L domain-containing protein [Ferruginibacter sp.]
MYVLTSHTTALPAFYKHISLLFFFLLAGIASSFAQLNISLQTDPLLLAQKLVGDGVVISNVILKSGPEATGFFNLAGGAKLNIDSGIVLTNGRAKTPETPGQWGCNGNGIAFAENALATWDNKLPGDGDIARQLGIPVENTFDATVLEFDFVPLGDSIKFRYVFSSEEYTPDYVCQFNDAFAFFISGPGIAGGIRNIALVPNKNIPVSIFNVNDVAGGGCPNNIAYFVDNSVNQFFTHDGHTTVLTAEEKVQPCQTYHLKLVISDVGDGVFDSGVFLEAKSLTSNVVSMQSSSQVDQQNNNYLVEGCATGTVKVIRPRADNSPLNVNLVYTGTAVNGTDFQLLPQTITIPPLQKEVILNIVPVIDNIPEGTELLKIYALGGCNASTPSDSVILQLRDYDTLGIQPPLSVLCKGNAVQLNASPGYSQYKWDADPTLSNVSIRNPLALPVNTVTTYYCTATEGTCRGRDSATVIQKMLDFIDKAGVNCRNGATGYIKVSGGWEWLQPVQYSINNSPYQADSNFYNLPAGIYTVRIKDAAGCTDSILVDITQLYPDLLLGNTQVTAASCSGDADGTVLVTGTGGNMPYSFSADGINFQTGNTLFLNNGSYNIVLKDANGCTAAKPVLVPLNNTVTVDAGADKTICEGKRTVLDAVSNAVFYVWTPAATISDGQVKNPEAFPVITTRYYVTARTGICTQTDSVTVFVNPAPHANAGADKTICFKAGARLEGSGGIAYWWYPASYLDDRQSASPLAQQLPGTITYALHVTDDKGCVSLKSDSVTVTVTRPAVLYAGHDTSLAIGQPLQLYAKDVNNIGLGMFSWSPAYALSDPFVQSPVTKPEKDIVYTVAATTAYGCAATDTIKIKVYRGPEIYVPNIFTPNGDGRNDVLKAIPVGIQVFHYFRVFDRWGNLVFYTSDPSKGWDGKHKGAASSAAAYSWVAAAADYKGNILQRKGSFVLIR